MLRVFIPLQNMWVVVLDDCLLEKKEQIDKSSTESQQPKRKLMLRR